MRFALPLGGIFALLTGLTLHGAPAGPDVEFTRLQVFGVFLVASSFALAVLGWGAWLCQKLAVSPRARWMMALALGTLASSFAAMAAGLFGLISYEFSWVAVLWMGAGWWLGGKAEWQMPAPRPKLEWVPVALFLAGLALWLASASLANGGSDPFTYHLLAPRIWADLGRITFRPWYSATPLASHWEYLFIWGNLLLGGENGRGLISGQLFGQFLHVELGVTLVCGAIYVIAADLTGRSIWAWLAVILCLCSKEMDIIAFIAKNDYGAAGWALTGAALLFVPGLVPSERRPWQTGIAGFFLGISVVSKMVLALPVGVLMLVWVAFTVTRRGGFRQLSWVSAAFAFGILPNALRNFVIVGDPFYPYILMKLGIPTPWRGPTLDAITVSELGSPGHDIRFTLASFWRSQLHLPYLGPMSLAFPLAAWARKDLRRGIPYFLAAELSMLAFASWHFGSSFSRWLAPALFLHVVVAVAAWAAGAEFLAARLKSEWVRAVAFAIPAAIIYGTVGFDWTPWRDNVWRNALFGNSPTLMIRNNYIHHGGDAMAWLRMNLEPGERVVTTGFQMLYYLSQVEVATIPFHPPIDEATFGLTDPKSVVATLREFGVRYVLDVAHWKTRYYPLSFGAMFYGLSKRFPPSVVFEGYSSFIVDIEVLDNELSGSCKLASPGREWDWYV